MLPKLIYKFLRKYLVKKVKIVHVIDGDTFVAADQYGNRFKIRVWAVDCPELSQTQGQAAKEFATNLLKQKWVRLVHKGKDKYGRNVCKVVVEGQDVGLLLLKHKYAFALKNSPFRYKLACWTRPKWFTQKPWNHRKNKF